MHLILTIDLKKMSVINKYLSSIHKSNQKYTIGINQPKKILNLKIII